MPARGADRVLVTGASGFIGSHLVAHYLERGAAVASLSRTLGRCEAFAGHDRFEHLAVDLNDRETCGAALREFEPDLVLHYASVPDGPDTPEHARACVNTNTLGTLSLIEAFDREGGVFVYGDTTKVYGNEPGPYTSSTNVAPNSAYATTKAAGWDLCRVIASRNGVHAVSVRPTLIYGPGQPRNVIAYVLGEALRGAARITLQGGRQTRDPLYVADAIDAITRAAARAESLSGESVVIGGGEEVSIEELARLIVEAVGASSEIVTREHDIRDTEIWRSAAQNDEASALLGWTPSTDLREGIRRLREALAQNPPSNLTSRSLP